MQKILDFFWVIAATLGTLFATGLLLIWIFDPVIFANEQPYLTSQQNNQLGMELAKRFWIGLISAVVWFSVLCLLLGLFKKINRNTTRVLMTLYWLATVIILYLCG
ncbi:MAG: hypothetical protein COV55_03575 [Candidatus Komeilibacteria bacterium CG11_big_fil_rev_8_21_14_0_20_36_20]|uniref:Uncharacterized protein n=1 Tax=Candidatus Komeilibacteria bacterium CG11_big_fil_rev_8_21_14_0_20_36_20 TaxID=1974477 RepID=A0A2H0NCF4_9BACT|nr:MAG: hypothetical protein COV55_03575 [Candidatus Komeilibacteria bacterium CG11_big_fil_rev_8_21_14_0_20_36_20]PIR81911.1 MAG: hypothetical protein COU21_01020 [Candidatus Komeilibacteria bacterium CG10_big_fil_rev_8_21_14_0_10_36_65]PJC55362.1 MAG: hypothetical protein CO027_02425 [Candidatus Komeilibacteria bacterium CG_4_9_14_0_2_um_filter_36_13]